MFVGPEVKRLINAVDFLEMLSKVERTALTCFVSVVNGFLGNHKAEKYRELVDGLVDAYQKIGCRMSLKVHVLHAHLDEFKDNMETTQKSKVKDFTRMSGLLRNDIKDNTMKV